MAWLLAVVAVLANAAQPGADDPLTAADGQRLEEAIASIVVNASTPAEMPREVTITARSVNAFFRFQGAGLLPSGIGEPELRFLDSGRISGRATIDLDQIRTQRERGQLDPLRYVSGQVEVLAVVVAQAADHVGQVEIESISIGGIPMPPAVLVELVRHYSRTEQHPGVDITEPFTLPYAIAALRVESGRAVIEQ